MPFMTTIGFGTFRLSLDAESRFPSTPPLRMPAEIETAREGRRVSGSSATRTAQEAKNQRAER